MINEKSIAQGYKIIIAISIACEAFMFDTEETIRSCADPLSKALDTDVMAASCYDSDYLRLALLNVNDKTDGWINVGKSYDPLIRRIWIHVRG
ncbi:hypothetical protein [Butyrivibrio sp. VCD2006]|uniref:hypothetical protein n=1 Tax=Butyrivibrio sp. VCD2006 TaxID=1280664 RepID=UPI000426E29A|nr:hypothetical protein [Butyrivibrio sp. VCD2006]